MSLTFDEAIKIIEKAKELGVEEFHTQGLTVKFRKKEKIQDSVKQEPLGDIPADSLVKPLPSVDEYTAEELLYYATPHFDLLQAEKEAKKKAMEGNPS